MLKKIRKKGFVLLFVTVLALLIMAGIAFATALLAYHRSKVSLNIIKSIQSYYAAESGLEDILLKVKTNPGFPASIYALSVGDNSADISISNIVGGSRTIESQGNADSRIRKVRVIYSITADAVAFHYGAQVGEGGMQMGNNSRVKGNVFSNGSVVAPAGIAYIDNSLIVAGSGNKMDSITVGENASVHTCVDSDITGALTYVSGGSVSSCVAGSGIVSQPNEIDPMPLPISPALINGWKEAASAGGIVADDIILGAGINYLGPVQIGTLANPKNLTVDTNAILKLTGTVYITGNLIIKNNGLVSLDPVVYGSLSGTIIADGIIDIYNNSVLGGSGLAGSYILLLSTNNSVDPANPAISIKNNAAGAIFYASNGLIYLNNNMKAREVTGYKIRINNNAEIEYESGLENALFSSGPGGSWEIKSWEEIK